MKRLHINLPDDVHDMLRIMCDRDVRSVSSQVQFLIREASSRQSGGQDGAREQEQRDH